MQKTISPSHLRSNKQVFCIGGANIDRKGNCANFLPRTSNIVQYHYSPGGVAWNVAASLHQLDIDVKLLTVIGADCEGNVLLDFSRKAGLDISHFIRKTLQSTGNYTSYHDANAEMLFAFADMAIYDDILWRDIEPHWNAIKKADIVFMDTNLPASLIASLIDAISSLNCLLVVDPVSVAKSSRLPRRLDAIHFLLPNEEEGYELAGQLQGDVQEVAKVILERGVQQLIITQGERGLWYQDKQHSMHIPGYKTKITDVTGAGDAFTAGLIYGLAIESTELLQYGMAAASITLASHKSVAEELHMSSIKAMHNKIQKELG